MSKFDSCLTSLNLRDSVPVDALRTVAADYQAGGMEPAAAMLRAVEDQLQLAQMEEANIVKIVGEAFDKQGGKRKVPDLAPDPEANAAPEPKPEPAKPEPAPAAEPKLTPVEEAPAPIKAEQEAAPVVLPKPWDLTQDEFAKRAEYLRDGNSANPWSANWDGNKLDAEHEEFDHPDLGKMKVSGGRFFKTKKLAELTARGAHKRAIRRALMNGQAVEPRVLEAYPELKAQSEKDAKPKAPALETRDKKTRKKAEPATQPTEEDDLRASLTDTRTIEVEGQRRPIRNSLGELVAPDFAGQVEFWKNYAGPVDEKGRPVVEPKDGEARAANGSIESEIDGQVAQLARDGATADEVLALIEKTTQDADQRALAAALRRQKLQTHVAFGNPQGRYLSGNAEQANASYRASDDTAFLHKETGATASALHELVHAATLRALSRGGLAARQIKEMHAQVKAMPSFTGYYGITDPEEFIAEALTSPAFRQQLADTPAPGSPARSLWQKFVGLVRMALGLPLATESMLERVMAIAPDLMAENRATSSMSNSESANFIEGMRASIKRNLSVDAIAAALDVNRWLDRGLKLGPKAKVYRGVSDRTGKNTSNFGRGLYTTTDKSEAAQYGTVLEMTRADLPQNPLRFSDEGKFREWESFVAREVFGYRRASEFEVEHGGAEQWARELDPKIDGFQIGVGHGAFFVKFPDVAASSDIRASMSNAIENAANDIRNVRLPANYLVGDLFNQTGKISWWHKTIGTMDNLARRAPVFKPVYDAVQSFIGDVSRHAVSSADMAPTLLPKLENVADIVGAKRKKAVSAADTKAIGAPIFEGTLTWARDANGKPVKVSDLEKAAEALTTKQKAAVLIQKGIIDDAQNQAWMASPLDFYDGVIAKKYEESQLKAGVVWTDSELRSQFNLNADQVKLYHEFRSAIDKSLSDLTLSEMVKMSGKNAKGMLDKAIAAGSLDKGALLLRDHFRALAAADPDKADAHLDTANQIMNLADKGQDLIDRGYAPLTRFGKYTVYVEKGGEQVYFGMFESKAEASMMARKMTAEHQGATVLHGTVSEEAYKLFAGVSPETIELFGSMVGLDSQADAASTEVYQAYLKLAKNNRSAMKRMIQRKGIAGFSEDAGRVLAGFIYSNARLTSGNTHLGDIDEAAQKIPKQQGELMDAAMRLREHIRNPQQGTALGGLMFAQFLGGSVASAMVNLTQPFTMTFPFLSQYGGAVKSGQRIKKAIELAFKESTGNAQLDAALKWAADEGIVAPQEIHYLQNQAQGKAALQAGDGTKAGDTRAALNNAMTKLGMGWGKLFAMAELSNRRITFIAAYNTAVEEGKPNPAKFAEDAVSQTQGVYNSGNKPKWARNPVGGLLLTFKQYGISYLELLTRMAFAGKAGSPERAAGQKAALLMVAVLFLMSGWEGLPFWQDLEDVLDGIMQRLGYNFSTKRAKQAFLTDVLGEGGADFALKGVSSLPGMPIDVAGRFGMGNLLPGTGLFTKKDSYARDLGELAGPAGDLAKRAFTGAGKIIGGNIAGGLLEMSPAAVRNAAKGADMLATGSYQDARGYKVNETTMLEGAMKAIGFQPNSTADVQEQKGQALNMIGQARMRSMEISERWAQGMSERDPEMVQQAREQMNDWNAKNPETPIRIKMPNILKRVKAMKMDAINRTQKTAPKALKESVRAELAETRE